MGFAKKQTGGGGGSKNAPTSSAKLMSRSYALPTKPNEPPKDLTSYSVVVFGEKGAGKSSLAAQWRKPITFMFEPRRRNLRIRQQELLCLTPRGIRDKRTQDPSFVAPWRAFDGYVQAAIEDKSVETIIVDTADRAYDACINCLCYEQGYQIPKDANDRGAIWDEIKNEFERVLNSVLYAEKTLLCISHAKISDVTDRFQNVSQKVVPSIKPSGYKVLQAIADFVWYYGYHGSERVIRLRGDELFESANALDSTHFRQAKTGLPVVQLRAGESAESAYAALESCFANKLGADDTWTQADLERETETAIRKMAEKKAKGNR